MIHEMYIADTKDKAVKAYKLFVGTFESECPKVVNCLKKDKDSQYVKLIGYLTK